MSISAAMVMTLRARTGAGMMECKKFLIAANGDIDKAADDMRKAGQAKADKKADRIAAEGAIVVARSADKRSAVLLEINSETDFVARDVHFTAFAQAAVEAALNAGVDSIAALSALPLADGDTVEQARQSLVAKIGENIQLRRLRQLTSDKGVIGCYLHGVKIGVLVALATDDEPLAKDIAMHVAASRPVVLAATDVAAEVIAHEREIFMAQALQSGKPVDIVEKMIDGRMAKFVDEISLLGQPFVKDSSMKISQLLQKNKTQVEAFVCFEVGEGIDKKEDNFVEEVMAQVRD